MASEINKESNASSVAPTEMRDSDRSQNRDGSGDSGGGGHRLNPSEPGSIKQVRIPSSPIPASPSNAYVRDTSASAQISSPMMGNKRYNREKYYSAIKTGFKHASQGDDAEATKLGQFLLPPEMMLPALFPVMDDGNSSSNMSIIFSCWNTMVGSAVVALPYSFQETGIVFGIAISFVSFATSYYTCALIIETAKKDQDYCFTLKKYYGKAGYYTALVFPTILIFGAITVYFVVITQSLYPLLIVLCNSVFGMDLKYLHPTNPPYFRPTEFSCSHVAIFEYFLLVSVAMKKDLTIFIKMGSLGAVCVTSLIGFVVIYGGLALGDTTFDFAWGPSAANNQGAVWTTNDIKGKGGDWTSSSVPTVLMYNVGGASLAGVLCAGYFIHQCSLPIIQKAAHPEQNSRNVFFGYLMVFLTYIIVGILGYFAFTAKSFAGIYQGQTASKGFIEQNFLNMFEYDAIPACLIRTLIYVQLSCAYPLVNHFQRTILMNMIWKTTDIPDSKFKLLNVCISIVPLLFALFYPLIGNIIGIAASISAFFMVYLVPVLAYFKMKRLEIEHPLLANALQENEVRIVVPRTLPKNFEELENEEAGTGGPPGQFISSPKIVISDRFMKRQQLLAGHADAMPTSSETALLASPSNNEAEARVKKAAQLRQLNISFWIHMLIPLYGFIILISVLNASYHQFFG